jgi:phosphoglucosamine mutase
MPSLFGTDGIRGVANRDLTPDLALAIGRAAGQALAPTGGAVVIGRDTRVSGPMLQGALIAGLCSAGVDLWLCGIIPTPGVAWLTIEERARAGAVISASHNPVQDNGIKFFSDEGYKITPEVEEQIEKLMTESPAELPSGIEIGRSMPLERAHERYCDHLMSTLRGDLAGLRVVLDCAHGAGWKVGPHVFEEAGADLTTMNAEPDGGRINVDCGSTSLGALSERVVAEGAQLGFALDGDADRVLAVDERGEPVDGDRMLGLAALRLAGESLLENDIVVGTVMSNLGFVRALEAQGIEFIAAPVGDRYVVEAMGESGAILGGEQSGHVIFGEHATTGDGLLTSLQIAQIVAHSGEPLSRLAGFFEPFPQVLINVEVASKQRLDSEEAIWDEVAQVETGLGEDGRVLLRPSGTESLVRVMVEARDPATAKTSAERLAEVVRARLGA